MTARKKWILGAAAAVLLVLVAGGAVFALTRPPADVNNEDVAFEAEPTVTAEPTPAPTEPPAESKAEDPLRNFVWASYGYSKDRRKFLPASKLLRPPFWRVWSYTGSVLLEFSPSMAEGKLFLLKNNGRCTRSTSAPARPSGSSKIGHPGRLHARLRQRAHLRHGARAREGQAGRGLRAAGQGREDPVEAPAALADRIVTRVRRRPRVLRVRERDDLQPARRRRRRALDVQGLRAR